VAKFLENCREQFGHDSKLQPNDKQFGLRDDGSPYLKRSQIDAGITLFRAYDREKTRVIRETIAQLKAARKKGRPLRISVNCALPGESKA
jgi:hypothetical protein